MNFFGSLFNPVLPKTQKSDSFLKFNFQKIHIKKSNVQIDRGLTMHTNLSFFPPMKSQPASQRMKSQWKENETTQPNKKNFYYCLCKQKIFMNKNSRILFFTKMIIFLECFSFWYWLLFFKKHLQTMFRVLDGCGSKWKLYSFFLQ